MSGAHLAHMPVAQLIVKLLILSLLERLTETDPAAANGFGDVTNATLLDELRRHVFVTVALLLQADDTSVVGIVVSDDALWDGRLATRHAVLLDSLIIGGVW